MRVEDVQDVAFTEVMRTKKGKTVRADYDIVHADADSRTVRWDQRIDGTPFAAVLSTSETELHLEPVLAEEGLLTAVPPATDVTIELRQEMSGGRAVKPGRGRAFGPLNPSWGARLVRKAAEATLNEALDGLERISV